MIKNPPAVRDTWVRSLGQDDPLEKRMAITPVFLPEEFYEQRSLVGYSPWVSKELDTTEQLTNNIGSQTVEGSIRIICSLKFRTYHLKLTIFVITKV